LLEIKVFTKHFAGPREIGAKEGVPSREDGTMFEGEGGFITIGKERNRTAGRDCRIAEKGPSEREY